MKYHVFRSKKTYQKGRKAGHFDPEDYNKAKEFFEQQRRALRANQSNTITVDDLPDPPNAVGWSVVDGVLSALKHIYKEQCDRKIQTRKWDEIQTNRVDGLIELVKGRQKRIDARNCAEKDDETYEAFVNARRFPEVEHAFWKMGHKECSSKSQLIFSLFNQLY